MTVREGSVFAATLCRGVIKKRGGRGEDKHTNTRAPREHLRIRSYVVIILN